MVRNMKGGLTSPVVKETRTQQRDEWDTCFLTQHSGEVMSLLRPSASQLGRGTSDVLRSWDGVLFDKTILEGKYLVNSKFTDSMTQPFYTPISSPENHPSTGQAWITMVNEASFMITKSGNNLNIHQPKTAQRLTASAHNSTRLKNTILNTLEGKKSRISAMSYWCI